MKVLLDVGISPRLRLPLQQALDDAPVESAVFNQWRTLRDDQLLAQAGRSRFTVLITADKKLGAQQRHPHIAVVAVDDNRLSSPRPALDAIARAVRLTPPGEYRLVTTRR